MTAVAARGATQGFARRQPTVEPLPNVLWQRVHLQCHSGLGRRGSGRVELHRPRQADAECLHRELHVWTAPALQGCHEAGARRGSGAFMYAAYECGPSHDRWP